MNSLQARLEVAVPIRDRGIDLVAYANLSASIGQFTAKPIQLKAAWERSFVIEGKYERIRNLVTMNDLDAAAERGLYVAALFPKTGTCGGSWISSLLRVSSIGGRNQ
jgi:hypothetical protein